MAAALGCIAGKEIWSLREAGKLPGEPLGPRDTPFGRSAEIFRVEAGDAPLLLLPRCGSGRRKRPPFQVNDRANLYALKDLGVDQVVALAPGAAVRHTIDVGQLVILDGVIDQTCRREGTFFDDGPLGFLPQFPVFCPRLRAAAEAACKQHKLSTLSSGIAAVREGPRFETPAEVAMLNNLGAEVVTHWFAPEVFLARELQVCYAAVCCIVNYAQAASSHRRFGAGGLFGDLTAESARRHLEWVLTHLCELLQDIAAAAQKAPVCRCAAPMAAAVEELGLPGDWRTWLD